jgi:mannitol/fructose-specific phosphotransferase system IIA component (Ntr-type)
MEIDEPRGHDVAAGVQAIARIAGAIPHGDNHAISNTHVSLARLAAATVINQATGDFQIVFHCVFLLYPNLSFQV